MYQYKYFITNTLPYVDIKTNIYRKVNNKTELEIVSTEGVPYGTIPRRILLFLTSQMHLMSKIKQEKSKTKTIFLGKSFSDFMKNCGYQVSGGDNGNILRFKEQWKRLLSCTFKIKDLDGQIISFSFIQQNNDFNGYLEIDNNLYEHLLKNLIYIEEEHIKKLKNGKYGSLALDLYFWLIYRRYTLKKFTNLKYKDLQNQFGTGIKDISVFKAKLRQAFIVLSVALNIHASFTDNMMNIIDFSVKSALSKVSKFQKYLKDFTFMGKHKIKIEFQKDFMSLIHNPKTPNPSIFV